MKKRVVLGMSGGVDSSVSAHLLQKAGYEVIALFMRNWEADGICTAEEDFHDVIDVCTKLSIPYYTVNLTKEYQDYVFANFLSDLKCGLTPNPDVLCNREIKFDLFWKKAKEIGADFLATGHYARTQDGRLFKGKDPNKDQSYFLHYVKESALQNVLFPIGDLHKSEVREIARSLNLSVKDKKDSTGICFIGKRNFKEFVGGYLSYTQGEIRTLDGKILGVHDGSAYFTIGQRKGLKIGGEGDAWFVVDKDLEKNIVYVAQGKDHPALYKKSLITTKLSWIKTAPKTPFHCKAKIRYRQEDQRCFVEKIGEDLFLVTFSEMQRAITPGQSIVFYTDDECLGGGKIAPFTPASQEISSLLHQSRS